jgi:hypothetical protein
MLQPKGQGTDTSVLVEVPLRGLQKKINETRTIQSVHCTIGALVKNSKGEVVDKLTRDRTFPVTDDQLKKGNFLEKMELNAPPGKYTLESAVMDAESGKVGFQRAEFTVEPKAPGVAISSIVQMRSYTPNAKGLDANEPFQFQGGSITPTLSPVVPKTADSMLRLFFTIYQDPAIAAKATVEMEFLQNGKSLQKAPLPLPAADAQGRIPYVMTIAASAIPVGNYEVRAIAKQGDTSASNQISIKIEAM